MKRPKKSKLQKRIDDPNSRLWRNKADRLWKTLVHQSYCNKCAICGSTAFIQAHHLIPREMSSHRHVIQNGIALCCSHHKYSFEMSPHKAPVAFFRWLQENNLDRWQWLLQQQPSRNIRTTYRDVAAQLEIQSTLPVS